MPVLGGELGTGTGKSNTSRRGRRRSESAVDTVGVNSAAESGRRRGRGAMQLDRAVRGQGDVNRDHAVDRVHRGSRGAGGSVDEAGG